jgi:hypothetical protein
MDKERHTVCFCDNGPAGQGYAKAFCAVVKEEGLVPEFYLGWELLPGPATKTEQFVIVFTLLKWWSSELPAESRRTTGRFLNSEGRQSAVQL